MTQYDQQDSSTAPDGFRKLITTHIKGNIMAQKNRVTADITTGVGTISFPHVFSSTASINDKGETVYDNMLS